MQERKYFDSGDYALSKAGKTPQQDVGTAIPNPQVIPHASTVAAGGSPPGASGGESTSPTGLPIHRQSVSHMPISSPPATSGLSVGDNNAASLVSTSPTASSSLSAAGRPAHPQVSTFPIGTSNADSAASGTAMGAPVSATSGFPSGGALQAGSPNKEGGSGLAKSGFSADDLMEE